MRLRQKLRLYPVCRAALRPNISKLMERSHLLDIEAIIGYDAIVSSAED